MGWLTTKRLTHARQAPGLMLAPLVIMVIALSNCASVGSQAASNTPTTGSGLTPTDSITATSTTTVSQTTGNPPTHAPNLPTPTSAPQKPSVHEVARTTTLTGSSSGPVTAACPAGEVALGGGWTVAALGDRVTGASISGATWSISVSHATTTTVTAYVECLRGVAGAVVTERTTVIRTAGGAWNYRQVSCNPGEVVVGWGFNLSSDFEFRGVVLAADTYIYIANHSAGGIQPANLAAECLSNATLTASYFREPRAYIDPGKTEALRLGCPAGTVMAGGAGESTLGLQGSANIYNLHTTNGQWQADIYNASTNGDVDQYPQVSVSCLTFQ